MRNIKDVARYVGLSLLSKGYSVSPLKLQKMLYYTQAWYMVLYGRENTLFSDVPEAWVNGPVYPSVYQEYRDKVPGMYDHLKPVHFDSADILADIQQLFLSMSLSVDEVETLDSIITLYGAKTQNQLILLTHSEQPWVEAREGLAPYVRSDRKILLDTMYGYYKARHDRNRQKG